MDSSSHQIKFRTSARKKKKQCIYLFNLKYTSSQNILLVPSDVEKELTVLEIEIYIICSYVSLK